MNLINVSICIWIIATLTHKEINCFAVPEEKKCRYNRVNKMLKARCYDMNLKEIPQYLNPAIEVLDVSFNRIKKLYRSSFGKYDSVRYLLLYENMIQTIEPDTFSYLTSLEEIDLSNNALLTIPMELLQLPSLRNLYIDSNDLRDLDEDLEKLEKPIQAPLEYLNVADCGLTKIPDFGIMPFLWHLNASKNPLNNLAVQSFAQMCHLRSVDFYNTLMPACVCRSLTKYLGTRGLRINDSIDCDILEESFCPNETTLVDNTKFEECNLVILNKEAQNRWLYVAGGVGGFLLISICILVWFHSRNSTKRRRKMLRTPKKLPIDENTSHGLLKNSRIV